MTPRIRLSMAISLCFACSDSPTQGGRSETETEVDEMPDSSADEADSDVPITDFCGSTTVIGYLYAAPPNGGWVFFGADGRFLRNDQDSAACTLSTYSVQCQEDGRGIATVPYCDNGEKVLDVPIVVLDESNVEIFGTRFHRESETTLEVLLEVSCGDRSTCRMYW